MGAPIFWKISHHKIEGQPPQKGGHLASRYIYLTCVIIYGPLNHQLDRSPSFLSYYFFGGLGFHGSSIAFLPPTTRFFFFFFGGGGVVTERFLEGGDPIAGLRVMLSNFQSLPLPECRIFVEQNM